MLLSLLLLLRRLLRILHNIALLCSMWTLCCCRLIPYFLNHPRDDQPERKPCMTKAPKKGGMDCDVMGTRWRARMTWLSPHRRGFLSSGYSQNSNRPRKFGKRVYTGTYCCCNIVLLTLVALRGVAGLYPLRKMHIENARAADLSWTACKVEYRPSGSTHSSHAVVSTFYRKISYMVGHK